MDDARLRRLFADFREVTSRFRGHPYIEVRPDAGDPPHLYRVHYRLVGISRLDAFGAPLLSDSHTVMVDLHDRYPRMKPRCVPVTPVFHPNFGATIALGDVWQATDTLGDIVVQIGQMIQFQSYNPKSPLNPAAARWAAANEWRFPVGVADLTEYDGSMEISLDGDGQERGDGLEITLGDPADVGAAEETPPPFVDLPRSPPRETDDLEIELR